jgi:FkbM family methyltransferase
MTKHLNITETLEQLSPNLVVTDSKVGKMAVYKNDSVVSQSILFFGEYCDAEVQVMSRYLTHESTYLDIGTNIGYHALAIYQQVGCPVLAFEPHPNHFSVAAYNCKDKPIRIYNAAIGSKNGTMTISNFDENISGNYGEVGVNNEGIEVQVIKLDNLEDLTEVTLMKIDVEGAELDVLKGAAKTIKNQRPVIFYEALNKEVWGKCYKWLDARDYKQYWVVCRHKPINKTFKENDINPFGLSGVSNILAVPIEKEQPDYLCPVNPTEEANDTIARIMKYVFVF